MTATPAPDDDRAEDARASARMLGRVLLLLVALIAVGIAAAVGATAFWAVLVALAVIAVGTEVAWMVRAGRGDGR